MLSLLAAALLSVTPDATVTLRAGPVEVASAFVHIEDVADVEGGGWRLRSLVLLTLGGQAAYVTRDLVRLRLHAAGLDAELEGPAYVIVRRAGTAEGEAAEEGEAPSEAGGSGTEAVLRAAVLRGIHSGTKSIVLQLDGVNAWGGDGPVAFDSLENLRVEASGGGADVRWVRFTARDGRGGRVHGWARFLVQERHTAVAARVPITRGELLTGEKVERKEIAVPVGRFDGFETLEAVLGRYALRDMSKGAVISPGDVQKKLMVRKGAALTAETVGQGFRVSDRVVALQDGEEGEVVKVRNARSSEVFRARVVSSHLVVPVD